MEPDIFVDSLRMKISALALRAPNSVCLLMELALWRLGQTSVFPQCSSQLPCSLFTCVPATPTSSLLPRHVSSLSLAPARPPAWTVTFHLPHQNPTHLSESCLQLYPPRKDTTFSGSLQQESLRIALIVRLLLTFLVCLYLI